MDIALTGGSPSGSSNSSTCSIALVSSLRFLLKTISIFSSFSTSMHHLPSVSENQKCDRQSDHAADNKATTTKKKSIWIFYIRIAHASSIRFWICKHVSPSISVVIPFLRKRFAATIVVPLPPNGSKTRSPGFE